MAFGLRNITEVTKKKHETLLDIVEKLGTTRINPIDLEIYHQIYYLYITKNLTLEETAESLRLSVDYVRNCLIRYKLPSHDSKLHIYDPDILRLYRQIKYYTPDIVTLKPKGISVAGLEHIHVLMSPDIKKKQSTRYKLTDLKSANYQWLPKIVPQYEDQDPDQDYSHWTTQYKLSNPIEKRIAAIRLTKHIVSSKIQEPKHPKDEIENCIDRLLNGTFYADDYWKVVEHYFGNEELKYYRRRPAQLLHILTDIVESKRAQISDDIITSRTVTECLYRKRLRIGYQTVPNLVSGLENLCVTGPIYDPYPGIGCLALACARLGIDYYYGSNDFIFNRAIENGFLDDVPGRFFKYDGREIYFMASQNLPSCWYPHFGNKSKVWIAAFGGNSDHLKKMIKSYEITGIYQASNHIKMLKFNPVAETK